MTPEKLREACKMAGLQVFDAGAGQMVNTGFSTMFLEDPALPAYVASLLLAKVRSAALHEQYMSALLDELPGPHLGEPSAMLATDEQRINAAMEMQK